MKLCSVVLAGGVGERFGGNKLGVHLAGKPLLTYALAAAAAASDDIVVVVGTGVEVAELAFAWASLNHKTVRIVAATDQSEGMGASLRAGLDALDAETEGAFVFLGDMPFVPVSIIPLLADALARGAPAVAPAFEGVRGHPVLLGRRLIARRSLLAGDRGAGALLSREPGLVLIETHDDGVVLDIDTPLDFDEATARQARRPS